VNTVANFTGGKVSLHVANWLKITSDSWVKRTLAGDIIDFSELPSSSPGPHMIGFSKKEKLAMDKAVSTFHTQISLKSVRPWALTPFSPPFFLDKKGMGQCVSLSTLEG